MKNNCIEKEIPPLHLNIEVTDHCNLRCPMCFHSELNWVHGKKYPKKYIELSIIKNLMEQTKINNLHIKCISPFWSGEPLMHPRFLQIMGIIFESNKQWNSFDDFVINTNAVFLTQEISNSFLEYAAYLRRYAPNKKVSLLFSVDFISPEIFKKTKGGDGSLAHKVMENIDYFLRRRAEMGLTTPTLIFQFVIQKANTAEAELFLKYWSAKLDSYNARYDVTDSPFFFEDRDALCLTRLLGEKDLTFTEELDLHQDVLNDLGFYRSDYSNRYSPHQLISEPKPLDSFRRPCFQLWHALLITSQGEVVPCCRDRLLDMRLGNIKRDSFKALLNGDVLKKLRLMQIQGQYNNLALCARCPDPPGGFVSDNEVIDYLKCIEATEELEKYTRKIEEETRVCAELSTHKDFVISAPIEEERVLRIYDYYPHKDSDKSSLSCRKIGELELVEGADLEVIYRIPNLFGWVALDYTTRKKDWSVFSSLRIQLKGDGRGGDCAFIIKEADGDEWWCFIKDAFNDLTWKEHTLFFNDFFIPEWASEGDGLKVFREVISYKILFQFHSSAQEHEKIVHVGKIALGGLRMYTATKNSLPVTKDFKLFLADKQLPFSLPDGKLNEIDIVLSSVSFLKKEASILDVGCGNSPLPAFLAWLNYHVTVTDRWGEHACNPALGSVNQHESYKNRISPVGYDIIKGDFLALNFSGKKFEMVYALSAIEHFVEREIYEDSYKDDTGDILAIRKISSLVKDNGVAIITVPFHENRRENDIARNHGTLFERWYNTEDLFERIVRPSGLQLEKKVILPYLGCLILRKAPALKNVSTSVVPEQVVLTPDSKKISGLSVCLLSREYPVETGWGGIGTYTFNLATGLAAAGVDTHVICQSLDVDREYKEHGVTVHRVRHKSFFPFKGRLREFGLRWEYSLTVHQKLSELMMKRRIDVVEAPNLSGEGFVYSFRKKTPLVTRLHTHFSEVISYIGWKMTLDRRMSCFFEDVAVLRSDMITCSTKAHAELVAREVGIPESKIRIIPLGVSLPDIHSGIRKCPEPTVLFVGRLEQRKGIDVLMRAVPYVLREIPNVKFSIIGRDSFVDKDAVSFSGESRYSYKEQLLKILPVEYVSRVSFLGHVSSEELDRFYRECDIFVAPSLYESFGLIYVEAMSYAKPVIGCGVGGVPEVIKDNVTGLLVPPCDEVALARAIIKLLKDPQSSAEMGRHARKHVEKNFSKQKMTENTLDLYAELCRKNS